MKGVVTVAIVDPQDSTRGCVKQMLLGMDAVWLEAECSRLDVAMDIIGQSQADMVVVGLEPNAGQALRFVADLTAAVPDCSVLVVSDRDDSQTILQAMRAGAKEFLKRPIAVEEVAGAIERLGWQTHRDDQAQAEASKVITLAGATGGVGTTTLAVSLGCILAQQPNASTVLVDLDLALGDVDVCLDVLPEHTLADVAANISRLDLQLLKRSLTKHSSGLFLLPRPAQMHEVGTISGSHVKRIVGLLKAVFRFVLVDTSKAFQEPDVVAMEMADEILLVTQLDLPCLRNVVRVLTALEQRDGLADKVRVVMNRLGLEDGEISIKKAEQTIGRETAWRIPNDWRTVVAARNEGTPLPIFAPKNTVTQAIAELAAHYSGSGAAEAPRRRGLFSFLG